MWQELDKSLNWAHPLWNVWVCICLEFQWIWKVKSLSDLKCSFVSVLLFFRSVLFYLEKTVCLISTALLRKLTTPLWTAISCMCKRFLKEGVICILHRLSLTVWSSIWIPVAFKVKLPILWGKHQSCLNFCGFLCFGFCWGQRNSLTS